MPATEVETWLRRKVARATAAHFLGGVGLFLLAMLVLFITFWIVYGGLWFVGFGFRKWFAIPHAWCVGISLVVLVLLFIGNATTDREYLSEFSVTTGTVSDEVVTFHVPGVGMVSNANPLAPDFAHNAVKMITDASFSGPRLVVTALRTWQKARRLQQMDVPNAAAVMALLLTARGKVAFAEILPALGHHHPDRVFPPLVDLGGVLFLKAEPSGLTLTPELRAEFHGVDAA